MTYLYCYKCKDDYNGPLVLLLYEDVPSYICLRCLKKEIERETKKNK